MRGMSNWRWNLKMAVAVLLSACGWHLIFWGCRQIAVLAAPAPRAPAFYSVVNVSGPTTVYVRDLQGRVLGSFVTSERLGIYVEPVLGPPPPPPPPPPVGDPQEAFYPLVTGYAKETGEPWMTPPRGGELFRILGRGFGVTAGKVWWGVQSCEVITWAEGGVLVRLPARLMVPSTLRVQRADGRSNKGMVFGR